MDVSSNNYLSSSDPRLIDHIVYELKSQGIFDKFRKECIADVDTKPAYQNLRQRVEGSVTGFLKTQRWRPDMNKNQVRESLRRTISESGFLEIGVERIVDQVVNPKINSIFLPQVESVVYKYMGVQKPSAVKSQNDNKSNDINNLLPSDLEAVSPEPTEGVGDEAVKVEEPADDLKKIDDKIDEDESPPFEPLGEPSFLIQEDTVDSHLSGFSGLASHDSNHSTDVTTKLTTTAILETSNSESQPQQTSEENSVIVSNENSNSKSDSVSTKVELSKKSDDKHKDDKKGSDKHRSSSKHKSRHDSKDKKSSYDKSKDKSRSHSSRDGDKKYKRDDKDKKDDKDKDKRDDKDKDKERSRTSSSNSKHSSSRKSSSKSESKSDSKSKHDDKYKSKSRKDDKHHKSSSSSNKDTKKDDHYSLKDKKTNRRSTDRDSSDGHSGTQSSSGSFTESINSQKSNKNPTCVNSTGDSSNSEPVDGENKTNETKTASKMEKLFLKYKGKPKFASNIYEAKKLMKIRKMWGEIEKEREALSKKNAENDEIVSNEPKNADDTKLAAVIGTGPVVSKETWDAMEAKVNAEHSVHTKTDYYSVSDISDDKIQITDSLVTIEDDFRGFVPNPRNQNFQEAIAPLMDELETSITKQSHLLQVTKNHVRDASLPKVAFVKLQESEIFITPSMKHEVSPDFRNNNNKTKHFEKDSEEDLKTLPKAKRARLDKSVNHNLDAVVEDAGEKMKSGVGTTKAGHNLRNQQRYSSDDLYKPRLQFTSRRRTAKSNN